MLKAQQELLAQLVHREARVLQVLPAPKATQAPKVFKVYPVMQVQLDPKAPRVRKDLRATLAQLVHREARVLQALPVPRVILVLKATLGLKGLKVRRVPKEHQVLFGTLVAPSHRLQLV